MYEIHKKILKHLFNSMNLKNKKTFRTEFRNVEYKKVQESYSLISSIIQGIEIEDEDFKKIIYPILEISLDFEETNDVIYNNTIHLRDFYYSSDQKFRWIYFLQFTSEIYVKILSILEKKLFEIKIEINEMENPKLNKYKNEYDVAQDLYAKGEYEKAFMHARDTFQKDIEDNFKKNMKRYFQILKKGRLNVTLITY